MASSSLPPAPSPGPACPQCGGASAHPFNIGGVCLRCAGERVLLGDDFSLPPPLEHPGESPLGGPARIGVYEIVDEIGRGGMATVYAARQAGLDRIIALKCLAPGRGDAAGLELRFLREAQTAARLRHPHIIDVHDCGRADGWVYFTMDYIEGGDLAHRLREHASTPREAAILLQKVAGALAYTHDEGVLHRDLKSSNILLDGNEPRVADFGLAAQLDPGGDLTTVTGILGTPHYVAPEALRHGSAALTAASDVYSLGVILYEMLTGRMPFAGASPAELPGLIERCDPPLPRLLAPAVPRDLQTVCLKCLEREPARRYTTAAALEEDLRRYLAGEAILAQPPGPVEALLKYARRHRLLFLSAAAITATLVAATAVSTILAVRARQAEKAAAAEARMHKALADFLQNDLLAQASPGEEPDRDIRLRTVLDRAAKKIDGRFPDQPLLAADLHKLIGYVYDSLGVYDAELGHLERALMLRTRELGAEHPQTLSALSDLAGVYQNLSKLPEANRLLSRALELQRRILGPEHPDTLRTADALASNLRDLGRLPEAEALQFRTLAASRRLYPPRSPDLFLGVSTLASIRWQQGKLAEAETLFQEAADIQNASHGPEHPDTLTACNNLAVIYRDEGKFGEAAALNERTLAIRRRVLGPEHHDTLLSLNNLAGVYKAQGRLAESEQLHAAGLEIARRTLGPEHHEVLIIMGNLADTYRREGKLDQAATLMGETLALRRRVLGLTHPHTLITLDLMGDILLRQGRNAEAEPILRESYDTRHQLQPEQWMTAAAASQLGWVLGRLGRAAEAEPLLLSGCEQLRRQAASIPALRRRIVEESADHLAEFYAATGRPDLAAEWRAKAVPDVRP